MNHESTSGGARPGSDAARLMARARNFALALFLMLVCCAAAGILVLLLRPLPGQPALSPAGSHDRALVRKILLNAAFGRRLTKREKESLRSLQRSESGPAINRRSETLSHP